MSSAIPIPSTATHAAMCISCNSLVFFNEHELVNSLVRFPWSDGRTGCKGVNCPSCTKFVPYRSNAMDGPLPGTMKLSTEYRL